MMKLLVFATLIAASLAAKSYDGYKVLRFTPHDDRQLRAVSGITKTLESMGDFWKHPSNVGSAIDVMVSPENSELVQEFIESRGFEVETMISDVGKLDREQRARPVKASSLIGFNYDKYHQLDEINAWMEDIESQYSSFVSLEQVASSYEGRSIRALKIGSKKITQKPIIWLQGGIHAREWVSPATMMYFTKYLVQGYGLDSDITEMLNQFDFYIIINHNPDGYVYTWTVDRMWRKTRSLNERGGCDGVDPNRNWDFQWGNAGKLACRDDYQGTAAHTEVEVRELTNFVSALKDSVKVFIDFHAYSQMWMTPWGYTKDLPADFIDQYRVSNNAMAALEALYGTKYQTGSIANIIYEASGSSADWAYGAAGIKYSYAVELRDTGDYGFLLPAIQIRPTAEEAFEAVKVIVQAVADEL